MLVWATEFPVTDGNGCDDVLAVAKGWLITSPHSRWNLSSFGNEPMREMTRHEVDGQSVTVGRIDLDGQRWAGLQYQWLENGRREWIAEVVAHQSGDSVLVSVRLERSLLQPGINTPAPNKPFVIKRLLQDLGGGNDNGLIVVDRPHRLAEAEVHAAAAIVRGNASYRLPVVYVSVGKKGQPFVDPDRLAARLGGMAHVVVEPSRYFSFALARNVDAKNVYGGAVGIYWPNGAASQERLLPTFFDSGDEMQKVVEERVRVALTQIRPLSQCTFGFLRELISKARVDDLRSQGSTEVQSFVDAFDAEIKAKDERLQELGREVQRLRAELRRYDEAPGESGGGVLLRGKEVEFYPGELSDAIIQTLSVGRNSLMPDGRRQHLMDDLLAANESTGTDAELTDDLKEIFAEAGDTGGGRSAALEGLGFSVEDAGKHAKAVYRGDDRYTFAISKTSSDHRAGKNMASTIVKKLFK